MTNEQALQCLKEKQDDLLLQLASADPWDVASLVNAIRVLIGLESLYQASVRSSPTEEATQSRPPQSPEPEITIAPLPQKTGYIGGETEISTPEAEVPCETGRPESAEPAEAETRETAERAEPEQSDAIPSKIEVRNALAAVAGKVDIAALLQEMGYQRLSQVPESRYLELLDRAGVRKKAEE